MHLIEAPDISSAWLHALRHLVAAPRAEEFDLVVRIDDPSSERAEIRTLATDVLPQKAWPIETTANTIFPNAMARTSRDPAHLASRYRALRQRIRRASGANAHGTYFERLVSYPSADRVVDQLANVIERAREKPRMGFVYELLFVVPATDTRPMGFPCLSYVNLKFSGDRLLLTAHYRNHYFVSRAYGNYVGLARLQAYIAKHVGASPGPLVCISGHAQIDPGCLTAVRRALAA